MRYESSNVTKLKTMAWFQLEMTQIFFIFFFSDYSTRMHFCPFLFQYARYLEDHFTGLKKAAMENVEVSNLSDRFSLEPEIWISLIEIFSKKHHISCNVEVVCSN